MRVERLDEPGRKVRASFVCEAISPAWPGQSSGDGSGPVSTGRPPPAWTFPRLGAVSPRSRHGQENLERRAQTCSWEQRCRPSPAYAGRVRSGRVRSGRVRSGRVRSGRVRVVVPARVLLVQSVLSVSPFCRRGLVLFYLAGHAGMPRGVVVSLWITLRRPKRVLFSPHVRSGAWLAPARRADDSDKSLLSKSGSVASADLGHLSPLYGRKVTKIAAKCLVAADRALSEAEVEAAATGMACLNQS